jgi:hypothetical protein
MVLLFVAGCQSVGGGQAVSAAVLAANIGVASAASRASGGCFTQCAPGTSCDAKSGLCETLPCRGECRQDQWCDNSGLIPRCVTLGSGFVVAPRGMDAGTALITPE